MCTAAGHFSVLQYDAATHALRTLAQGDVAARHAHAAPAGARLAVDAAQRAVALHLYQGLVTIVPLDAASGALRSAFSVRVDELDVFDLAFVATAAGAPPTLAVLYEDDAGARHVASYTVHLDERRALERAPLRLADAPRGARFLLPVAAERGGGVLLACDERVLLLRGNDAPPLRVDAPSGAMCAAARIDADGSRWLLGDHMGGLRVLLLRGGGDGAPPTELAVELLGRTSCAECLAYLDSGVLFLGSRMGDSQLLRLRSPDDAVAVDEDADRDDKDDDDDDDDEADDDEDGQLEVLETYPNLGPIVDMCAVDLERDGQCQLVTCSGAFGDGSLRVVRQGVGIEQHASVDLEGMRRLWSLRSASAADADDRFVVMSFTAATRVLAFEADELEERELGGFVADAPTLCAGTMPHEQLLQVTERGVRLVAIADVDSVAAEWTPDGGASVSCAEANNAGQVVLALGGGVLVYLECGNGSISEVARTTLPHEIACVDATPVSNAADGRAALCAVGLWKDASARVLLLPSLEQVAQAELGRDALPRRRLARRAPARVGRQCAAAAGRPQKSGARHAPGAADCVCGARQAARVCGARPPGRHLRVGRRPKRRRQAGRRQRSAQAALCQRRFARRRQHVLAAHRRLSGLAVRGRRRVAHHWRR